MSAEQVVRDYVDSAVSLHPVMPYPDPVYDALDVLSGRKLEIMDDLGATAREWYSAAVGLEEYRRRSEIAEFRAITAERDAEELRSLADHLQAELVAQETVRRLTLEAKETSDSAASELHVLADHLQAELDALKASHRQTLADKESVERERDDLRVLVDHLRDVEREAEGLRADVERLQAELASKWKARQQKLADQQAVLDAQEAARRRELADREASERESGRLVARAAVNDLLSGRTRDAITKLHDWLHAA